MNESHLAGEGIIKDDTGQQQLLLNKVIKGKYWWIICYKHIKVKNENN